MLEALVPQLEPLFRVGLVGFGRIALRHIDALLARPKRLQLVALCDPDPDARDRALALGVPVFEGMEEMMSCVSCDLIILATPSGLHPEQVVCAAQAGAHILVEKPLALELDQALLAMEACVEANVGLYVVHPLRHWETNKAARRWLEQGLLGDIHTVDMRVFWTRPESYYNDASWRKDKAMDRGILHNQVNHYVDLMAWFFGAPDSVYAEVATLGWSMDVPNAAMLSMRWGTMLGAFKATLRTYPKNLEASLTILGEHGTLILSGPACAQIKRADFCDLEVTQSEIDALNLKTQSMRDVGHLLVYDDLLRMLDTAGTLEVADRTCLDALRLLDAVERSILGKKQILLDQTSHELALRT